MFRRIPAVLLFALAVCFAPQLFAQEVDPKHAEKMQQGLDLFKAKVRGVFIEKCLACHGGDEVESGFDLATRKGMLRGGSRGGAIVPGKSSESRLVSLITHNEDPAMPEGEDKLPPDAIAAIKQWIDLGAPYDDALVASPRDPDAWVDRRIPDSARDYWAFRPLTVVAPPAVKNAAWVKSPVDAFLLAKLEEKGIAPNPPVDKRRLIRRAYFDLIGLPPSPEKIAAFVNDADPEAYSKLLDELLANPHFGERWGRYWLDVARFAESHGFEQDYDRPHAYHYRDFVIEALNQDLPYDQFVKWQLAGDEFAPENPLALKATGFLGAGVFPTQITAKEVERTRFDALDDMAATTSNAMLALTIGCARCHDHKFDPIPQGDYYRFAAIFTTTVRSNLDVNLDTAGYTAEKAKWDADHAPLLAAVKAFERDRLPGKFAEWEKSQAAEFRKVAWRVLEFTEIKSSGGANLTRQGDGSILATGKNPDFDTYTFVAKTPLAGVTGVRLEALAHPSLVKGGPGRAENGNIALTDFRVEATLPSGKTILLRFQNPQATFEQPSLFVRHAIDADKKSAWAVDPQFGRDHAAVFELAEDVVETGDCTVTFTLEFKNNKHHNIGRTRISLFSGARPVGLEGNAVPQEIAAILDRSAGERTAEQTAKLLAWYAPLDADWQAVNRPVAEHLGTAPKPKTVKMMVCSEGVTPIRHHTQGADFFKDFYYLKRGDADQKQGIAPPGYVQALSRSPLGDKKWQLDPPADRKTSYRRTSLANWITDVEEGAGDLLARVMVNRLWQGHFGRGIVSTANDFGVQGTKPSHPELLEWLADDLQKNGWRMKRMHKTLMLSSAYLQSSERRDAAAKVDPDNVLLWRHTPRRLEAEIIRDSMLSLSGEFDPTQFGAGSLDEGHKRRSIYFTIKRSKLIPIMQLFDQPEPLASVGTRPSTTIAPQALAFLNNPHVRRYAQGMAKRLNSSNKSSTEKITQGYLSAVGRSPDAEELNDAAAFIEAQTASYALEKKGNAAELAWTDFCQVLFGLNEFVYVE